MRTVFLSSLLLVALSACGTTERTESPWLEPNQLMGQEIEERIEQIPYQHREELFNNLLWLAQSGEQAIPALLKGLRHNEPKVRSNCAWVLGQIHDRRVIPDLQAVANDRNETVRLEVARTLVVLGDLNQAPTLIEGLDSDKVQVRYLCHEALKTSTRRDFDYDHLSDDELSRAQSVYRWRQWWAKQSGDQYFASSYAKDHGLNADGSAVQQDPPAMPAGETAPRMQPSMQPMPEAAPSPTPTTVPVPVTEPQDAPSVEPTDAPQDPPTVEPTDAPQDTPAVDPQAQPQR